MLYLAQSSSACSSRVCAEGVANRCISDLATALWVVCQLQGWLCCMDAKRAHTDEGDGVASTAGWHGVFAFSSMCTADVLH